MNKQSINIPASDVTQEKIDAWKAEFEPQGRTIHRLKARSQTEGEPDKVCYVVSPDMKIMSFASAAGKADPLAFNKVILEQGWLAGDEEIKTNAGYFISVGEKLTQIIGIVESELEKL